jgi:hypothetical protein
MAADGPSGLRTALESAHRVATGISGWRLPPPAWREVAILLAQLTTAANGRDETSLRRLTGDLLAAAPVRVIERITGEEPPPPWISDRLNELIDTLSPPAAGPAPVVADPGALTGDDGVHSPG